MAAQHRFVFVSCLLALVLLHVSSAVDLTLDYKEEEGTEEEERECHGTFVGFGYSGTLHMHYQNLRKRYAGCSHIIGNLEITNLVDPNIDYDLDFLKNIRYVSGSVLIGLISEVDRIPLVNLKTIRGNSTYWLHDDDYSFVVVLTSNSEDETLGLKEIHLPALKEITKGKVLFTENPSLGYVNTIDWKSILRGREGHVHFYHKAFNESLTNGTVSSFCNNGPRWGDDEALCQQPTTLQCHEDCDGRCYGQGKEQCCHNSCAVGCSGPQPHNCTACKDFIYDDHCAGFCPAKSYPLNQSCVKYD